MFDDVKKLLETMGITGIDDLLLLFVCNTVTEELLNDTNQDELPEGLHFLAIEMTVGKIMRIQKNAGLLVETEGFSLDTAIKSIQEGDTNVTFAIGEGSQTPEARLDALIDYLENGRKKEVLRYRKLVW